MAAKERHFSKRLSLCRSKNDTARQLRHVGSFFPYFSKLSSSVVFERHCSRSPKEVHGSLFGSLAPRRQDSALRGRQQSLSSQESRRSSSVLTAKATRQRWRPVHAPTELEGVEQDLER